jgi:hypothetical protein
MAVQLAIRSNDCLAALGQTVLNLRELRYAEEALRPALDPSAAP